MNKNVVIFGDWIADVYIDNNNITQNQEIINGKSFKGYYNSLKVYPGGTGFVVENFINCINNDLNVDYNVRYMLPNFEYVDYNDNLYAFNLKELFDRSIKHIYNNHKYKHFDIIKMRPIYYLSDIIKPTVKFRFYSKKMNEVFYRFDYDNDIEMRHLNCNYAFKKSNNTLILIDYDKGCFTEESISNLLDDIVYNNWRINTLFLNTKPHKIIYFKKLISKLKVKYNTETIIQLNDKEYEPIKDIIHTYDYKYLIVTQGIKNILYFEKKNKKELNDYSIDISHTIINNVNTTSGCGDIFMSMVMYYYIFVEKDINKSIKFSIDNMKRKIIQLNDKLFM